MSSGVSEHASLLTDVFNEALDAVLLEYESRTFAPRTEADVQCELYAECLFRLRSQLGTPYQIHANWPLRSNAPRRNREKHDLVLGEGTVVVEVKYEADYPGVSKPVCFASEVAKDIERLKAARARGAQSCYLVFIDEDGTHRRNLHKTIPDFKQWRELQRADAKPSYLLHVSL